MSIDAPMLSRMALAAVDEIMEDNPEAGELNIMISHDGEITIVMGPQSCATERVLRYALLIHALGAEPREWVGGHPWRAALTRYDGHRVSVLCPLTPIEAAELTFTPIEA